jgi:hypothetical protein
MVDYKDIEDRLKRTLRDSLMGEGVIIKNVKVVEAGETEDERIIREVHEDDKSTIHLKFDVQLPYPIEYISTTYIVGPGEEPLMVVEEVDFKPESLTLGDLDE